MIKMYENTKHKIWHKILDKNAFVSRRHPARTGGGVTGAADVKIERATLFLCFHREKHKKKKEEIPEREREKE